MNNNQKISIKPDDIMRHEIWDELIQVIYSRAKEADEFVIDLENITKVDLSQYNALVMLYVKIRHMNKRLIYENCKEPSLINLIQKTQFDHVFHL